MDLKWIRQMAERINELEEENKRLKGLLEEQDNKQVLNMTKPQPCTVFAHAGTVDWVAKLNEEVYEVMLESAYVERLAAEADDDDIERLAEELTDVITVCTSWLDALGYDEKARGVVQWRVNEKNKKRGYF